MFDRKVPTGMTRDDYEEYIADKQTHNVYAAFERVSLFTFMIHELRIKGIPLAILTVKKI